MKLTAYDLGAKPDIPALKKRTVHRKQRVTVEQLAIERGLKPGTVRRRVSRGMSLDEALNTPLTRRVRA